MIDKFDKFLEVVFIILKVLLIILLVTMVGILIAHIWFRYVLNNSLTWSEELLKILLVWFGMLSVAVLAARREHVAIVIFKSKMPKSLANACTIFTQALTLAICIIGIVLGYGVMIYDVHKVLTDPQYHQQLNEMSQQMNGVSFDDMLKDLGVPLGGN